MENNLSLMEFDLLSNLLKNKKKEFEKAAAVKQPYSRLNQLYEELRMIHQELNMRAIRGYWFSKS